jgi:hypothetical protein
MSALYTPVKSFVCAILHTLGRTRKKPRPEDRGSSNTFASHEAVSLIITPAPVLTSLLKVSAMENETPRAELMRLLKAQLKARQNEVFGGLSHAEQAEYNRRAERICELEEGMNKKP